MVFYFVSDIWETGLCKLKKERKTKKKREKGVRRHSICCCCWKYWSFTACNVYLSEHTGTDWCVHGCVSVRTCVCLCVHVFVCMCARVHVCAWAGMHVAYIYAVIVTAQPPSKQTEISTDTNWQYCTTYSTISAVKNYRDKTFNKVIVLHFSPKEKL